LILARSLHCGRPDHLPGDAHFAMAGKCFFKVFFGGGTPNTDIVHFIKRDFIKPINLSCSLAVSKYTYETSPYCNFQTRSTFSREIYYKRYVTRFITTDNSKVRDFLCGTVTLDIVMEPERRVLLPGRPDLVRPRPPPAAPTPDKVRPEQRYHPHVKPARVAAGHKRFFWFFFGPARPGYVPAGLSECSEYAF